MEGKPFQCSDKAIGFFYAVCVRSDILCKFASIGKCTWCSGRTGFGVSEWMKNSRGKERWNTQWNDVCVCTHMLASHTHCFWIKQQSSGLEVKNTPTMSLVLGNKEGTRDKRGAQHCMLLKKNSNKVNDHSQGAKWQHWHQEWTKDDAAAGKQDSKSDVSKQWKSKWYKNNSLSMMYNPMGMGEILIDRTQTEYTRAYTLTL